MTPGALSVVRRTATSVWLLAARRPWLFVVADALIILVATLQALLGRGDPESLYVAMVIVPTLLLGVPLMSDVIGLERRAGTLDLALSSPRGRWVFERRLAGAAAVVAGQAVVIVVLQWMAFDRGYPLLPPLTQAILLAGVLAPSLVLFWATRVQSAGGVAAATLACVGVLAKWSLWVPWPGESVPWMFVFHGRALLLRWGTASLVLLLASALAYMHARRRLDRPELLLS